MNKCYYVYCPLPCHLQKRGRKCVTPWRRKNLTVPIDKLLFGRELSQSVTKRSQTETEIVVRELQ